MQTNASLGTKLVAFAATLLAIIPSDPVAAQETPDDLLAGAVCMVRAGSDGSSIDIIVPLRSAPAMRAKGYERQPCRQSFETAAQRDAYRDGVCHMASTYREEQLVAFEKLYGERPGVLCGMAEVVIAQWQFRSGT